MRKSNEQDISEVMRDFFKSFKIDSKVHEIRIKEVWLKVMGPTMARYTEDIRLYKGVLTLTLLSAPLKQELLYNKQTIIDRLNDEFAEKIINEIKIY